eukprot:1838835-Pleurochrysis_carterae.AAC.1
MPTLSRSLSEYYATANAEGFSLSSVRGRGHEVVLSVSEEDGGGHGHAGAAGAGCASAEAGPHGNSGGHVPRRSLQQGNIRRHLLRLRFVPLDIKHAPS